MIQTLPLKLVLDCVPFFVTVDLAIMIYVIVNDFLFISFSFTASVHAKNFILQFSRST